MNLSFICPFWGQEDNTALKFFSRLIEEQYDGVEINLPDDTDFIIDFRTQLDAVREVNRDFVFIAQQVVSQANETAEEYLLRMKNRLSFLVTQQPDFINSHTGKDYFSFDDNCRIIEAAENIASRAGIPIVHETHRGRFTFHAASLLPYLEWFPDLKLTGDFSHWCAVSESMLFDQEDVLKKIIPSVVHIHARIGFEHGPQVNDPFAPEWSQHVDVFFNWWNKILDAQYERGNNTITITPEFGPVPYMPTLPYSRKPLSDQWMVNAQMKNLLNEKLINNYL